MSWYPPGKADPNGEDVDKRLPYLLDAAAVHGLKIAFHMEPWYKKESNLTEVRKALQYVTRRYGKHKALYRCDKKIIWKYSSFNDY